MQSWLILISSLLNASQEPFLQSKHILPPFTPVAFLPAIHCHAQSIPISIANKARSPPHKPHRRLMVCQGIPPPRHFNTAHIDPPTVSTHFGIPLHGLHFTRVRLQQLRLRTPPPT